MDEALCDDTIDDYGVPIPAIKLSLDKRAGKGYGWITTGAAAMRAFARPHPTGARYMELLSMRLRGLYNRYFRVQGTDCPERRLRSIVIDTESRPARTEIEHGAPVGNSPSPTIICKC
jgi:hypothetical protein